MVLRMNLILLLKSRQRYSLRPSNNIIDKLFRSLKLLQRNKGYHLTGWSHGGVNKCGWRQPLCKLNIGCRPTPVQEPY